MNTDPDWLRFFFKSTFRIKTSHSAHISMIMNELHSNMPLIHIEPSASDDMRIGIESIGESGDDSSTRTVKRARTSSLRFEEITNTMPIDMSNGDIPHIEMTPN